MRGLQAARKNTHGGIQLMSDAVSRDASAAKCRRIDDQDHLTARLAELSDGQGTGDYEEFSWGFDSPLSHTSFSMA